MDKQPVSKQVRRLHILSRKLVDNILAGNYYSVFKGPGLEFNEVRDYMVGDDARFIDWNVSSRMGNPYTKTFKEEREIILFTLIDISRSLNIGTGGNRKKDVAGFLFSLIAHAAIANNDRVGSLLFTDRVESFFRPTKGNKNVLKQISRTLDIEPQGKGSDLSMAIRAASESMRRRGICFIISDFRTTKYRTELSVLARKHDVIAIRITDPIDTAFPPTGLIEIEDEESGERIKAFGKSPSFRRAYSEQWEVERLKWRTLCRSLGIDTVEISTQDDPAEKLISFFEMRKRR